MAPRDKVSAAQKSFLEAWVDAYLEGKKGGRLDKVWVPLFHDWFQKWPVVENANIADKAERSRLHGEIIERWKTYIKRWFQNHAIPRARGLPIYDLVEKYLKLHAARGKRAPQLLQFYCKKKFATRILPIVKAKIAALPSKPTSGERLKIVREVTASCFEGEGDEEKQAIQDEFDKAKAALEQPSGDTLTPASYAEAIKDLPSHFEAFAQLLGVITGWKFTLLAGGPDPRNGGRINTIAVHYGENHAGATWGVAMPNFKESIAAPFSAFLNSVYTPSDCASRALHASRVVNASGASEAGPPAIPSLPPAPAPVVPADMCGQIFPPNVGNTPSTIPINPSPFLLSLVDELNTPLPSDFIDPTGCDFLNIDFTIDPTPAIDPLVAAQVVPAAAQIVPAAAQVVPATAQVVVPTATPGDHQPLADVTVHLGKRSRDNPDASLIVTGKRVRKSQTRKEIEPTITRGKEN
ncbi:hypothetical protein ONZ45_g17813 [Pleurotus djamor]|nr:hypothetical protein ONZ45_g17813 [Pleurotus djamor]